MTALDCIIRLDEEIQSLWEDYRSQCESATSREAARFAAPSFSAERRFNFIDWPEDLEDDDEYER